MEQFKNLAQSTLAVDVNNSTTTLIVAIADLFPLTGEFRIIIDSELMKVTNVTGTTFTVVRGTEDTTAVAHTAGAKVTHVLTAEALTTAFQRTNASLTAIAALSTADGNVIVGNGATWVAESGNTARTSLGLGTGDSPTFQFLSLTAAHGGSFGVVDTGEYTGYYFSSGGSGAGWNPIIIYANPEEGFSVSHSTSNIFLYNGNISLSGTVNAQNDFLVQGAFDVTGTLYFRDQNTYFGYGTTDSIINLNFWDDGNVPVFISCDNDVDTLSIFSQYPINISAGASSIMDLTHQGVTIFPSFTGYPALTLNYPDDDPASTILAIQYNYTTVAQIDGAGRFFGTSVHASTLTGLNICGSGSKLGFFDINPVVRQTVTGSRGGNAALASLLTALAQSGLIINSSTA